MRVATGSHGSTGWWLVQRYTAVVMLLVGLALWFGFLCMPEINFHSWHSAFQKTGVRLLAWLLVAGICLHACIGLRDVLMDYVKPLLIRMTLNLMFSLVLIMAVVWTTVILWGAHGQAPL